MAATRGPRPSPVANDALTSVTNALRLLKSFSYDTRVIGASEAARRLGIAKSSAHRLLATLAAEGFLERLPGGQYRLGITLWELGSRMIHGIEMRDVAHPVLEALRNKTNETVHLARLDGNEVVYLDRFESQATLRLFNRVGTRNWAHCTSSGKAILSVSSDELVEQVLCLGLPRMTPRTITSRSALLDALRKGRELGYVMSLEESEIGVNSVGAPVFDHRGEPVGAVSVAGPSPRLTIEKLPRVGRLVKQAAHRISERMGYRPDREPAD